MTREASPQRGRPLIAALFVLLLGLTVTSYAFIGDGPAEPLVATTLEDFFLAGTQPETLDEQLLDSGDCVICHGISYPEEVQVAPNWMGSMMGQAARDPLFYACLAVANQDAGESGDLCIRCHSPIAWMEGRSTPTDASAFVARDRDGVTCHLCHRMVDPLYQPGISPPEDEGILADIDPFPGRPGSGNAIVDPFDRRRGPFDFVAPQIPPPHPTMPPFLQSPFHKTAAICGTCHDVSNPAYVRQEDGSYALGALDTAHPTGDQYDMFPIERTYSEWLYSDYPDGVDAQGRFGGDMPTTVVSTCQDCHMPDLNGNGCIQGMFNPDQYPPRPDMPRHDFAGGNSWVRDAIVDLVAEFWPEDAVPNMKMFQQRLQEGQQRSIEMLQLAATLDPVQDGARLDVRVTNETGHKLPTGYPEGRRMWLNVQFYDDADQLIAERGVYDMLNAELHEGDTKVYEINLGIDQAIAEATGISQGETFHFVLNNTVIKDNRIPPRGFTNAGFDEFGGKPVGATYADAQFWDDTAYALPEGAVSATVNLYYQTSSREYIEFLKDENVTNDWGNRLYDLWVAHGKSEPVLMATADLVLDPFTVGDFDGDDDADLLDIAAFDACYTGPQQTGYAAGCEVFDFDVDQDVDFADFDGMQRVFTGP